MEETSNKEVASFQKIPVCFDARLYLELLRGTSVYKQLIDDRLQRADESVDRQEVEKVFEEGEHFKGLFWDFYDRVVHLGYKSYFYSINFRHAFADYQKKAVASVVAAKMGSNEAVALNQERSRAHDQAAQVLLDDGVVETKKIGRILVRAFLVHTRRDFLASARQADQLRVIETLRQSDAGQETVKKYLRSQPPLGKEFFKQEEIRLVVDKFLENKANPEMVNPLDYQKEPDFFSFAR